jgi:alkylhydroperoxidase/carboxymuconolactone decarboxylase family protein YurZ
MTPGSDKEKSDAILARVTADRGIAREWTRILSERDPECMRLVHELTMHALHHRSALPQKVKELILISLNAFDYYEFGFRVHVRSALRCGATADEILEALEVVGVQKTHALTSMLPILEEELRNHGGGGEAKSS